MRDSRQKTMGQSTERSAQLQSDKVTRLEKVTTVTSGPEPTTPLFSFIKTGKCCPFLFPDMVRIILKELSQSLKDNVSSHKWSDVRYNMNCCYFFIISGKISIFRTHFWEWKYLHQESGSSVDACFHYIECNEKWFCQYCRWYHSNRFFKNRSLITGLQTVKLYLSLLDQL